MMQSGAPRASALALALAMPFGIAPVRAAPCLAERATAAAPARPAALPLRLESIRNGRLIAASGVELVAKGIVIPTRTQTVPGLADTAQTAATRSIRGRLLFPAPGTETDRYGVSRLHGRLDSPDGPSLAEALLQNGAGYADPTALPECRREVLAAEGTARQARRGIWAVDGALARAEAGDALHARVGTFAVVEGRVSGVRKTRGITYLYFAPPGHRALIVTVPTELDATILRYGPDPAMLRGTLIRVRGVVREDGGPVIAVRLPGQMDAVEERTR